MPIVSVQAEEIVLYCMVLFVCLFVWVNSHIFIVSLNPLLSAVPRDGYMQRATIDSDLSEIYIFKVC